MTPVDGGKRESVLYVNDRPLRRAEGGIDGGYVYEADRRMPVAVSFVASNGRAVRANFDPRTGEITTCELDA